MKLLIALAFILVFAQSLKVNHLAAPPPFPKGTQLSFGEGSGVPVTINYKYGSFLTIGGDQKIDLTVYNVNTPRGEMPLFVQNNSGYSTSGTVQVDQNFMYGFRDEFYFLVELDSTRRSHGIYQWRFLNELGRSNLLSGLGKNILDGLQGVASTKLGVNFDVAALFGDPLRSF